MDTDYNVFLVTYDLEGATTEQYSELEKRIRNKGNNCARVCKNVFILSSQQGQEEIFDSIKKKIPKDDDILIVTTNTEIIRCNPEEPSNLKKVFRDAEWTSTI